MRRGSILVMEGDRVVQGQPLGLIGLSGQSSFPHLHFEISHDDRPVDPFVGPEPVDACDGKARPLWRPELLAALDQTPPLLTSVGIAPAKPEKADVRLGWHRQAVLPATSPVLALWVDGYWFEPGDRVVLRLQSPERTAVVNRALEVKGRYQRYFSFAGAPRPEGGWPKGLYKGEVSVLRPGRAHTAVMAAEVELR
jgi:murein DD-endopeptidase MepM/ murein hydrolase activator NlpD